MAHHSQLIQQRHGSGGEILRTCRGVQRRQLQHQVGPAAQRHLRTQMFVYQGGCAPLYEIAAHDHDCKVGACKLLR